MREFPRQTSPRARKTIARRAAFSLFAACALLVTLATLPVSLAGGGKDDPLAFERARYKLMLENVAKTVAENYYDPTLHGVDWKALQAATAGRIDTAGSVGEMIAAIFGLVTKLGDSHTFFIPPAWRLQPEFGLDAQAFGDEIRVYRVKQGGAAEAAGVLRGDRILQVNGFRAERGTFGFMLVAFRRLNPVPKLDLVIQRGDAEPQTVSVTGKLRVSPKVEDLSLPETWWRWEQEALEDENENPFRFAKPGDDGIAYVYLPWFPASAYPEDFIDSLLSPVKSARALVLDLRGNSGGAVDFLRSFAGHFTHANTTLAEMIGRKEREPLKVKPQSPAAPPIVVVLVDAGSASASEIFARWVQLSHRGTVVGDRTAGAVMASRVFAMSIGGANIVPYAVQVTIQGVRFANGEQLEGRGVTPDVACIPSESELKASDDACRHRAWDVARAAIASPTPASPTPATPTPAVSPPASEDPHRGR